MPRNFFVQIADEKTRYFDSCENIRITYEKYTVFNVGYLINSENKEQETRINSYFLHRLQGFCDSAKEKYDYKVNYDSHIVFIIRNTKLENTLGIIDDYKIIMFWDFKKGA